MPCRVLALLLAVVLLWSGLNTLEPARSLASAVPERAPAAAYEGSVEDHHLDDLPSQAQSDPLPETPGVMPALLVPSAQRKVTAQPHPFASDETESPCLAGPLRPPCGAALAG
jgi:hypothetical protein